MSDPEIEGTENLIFHENSEVIIRSANEENIKLKNDYSDEICLLSN